MISPEFQFAQRATVFSLQCAAILDGLHKQDKSSTGFHRLAARTMAERALTTLDAVALNPGETEELLAYADEAADSSLNILRAYLKQRNQPIDDDDSE